MLLTWQLVTYGLTDVVFTRPATRLSLTTYYLLKLKAVGLDSDPHDLSMNQWSLDFLVARNWGPDIYMYLYIYQVATSEAVK